MLQSTATSPGSRAWRAASVRLCFHSLIPGTRLSSPRAAYREFNASLDYQNPRAGLHPHTRPLQASTIVPLFLTMNPRSFQATKR